MFAIAAMLLLSQAEVAAPSDCMGVLVGMKTPNPKLFVSFAVGGAEEQLGAIRKEALALGALAEPPKQVGESFMLFVFFPRNTIKADDAIELYESVRHGKFHPGVPVNAILLHNMFIPAAKAGVCGKP